MCFLVWQIAFITAFPFAQTWLLVEEDKKTSGGSPACPSRGITLAHSGGPMFPLLYKHTAFRTPPSLPPASTTMRLCFPKLTFCKTVYLFVWVSFISIPLFIIALLSFQMLLFAEWADIFRSFYYYFVTPSFLPRNASLLVSFIQKTVQN